MINLTFEEVKEKEALALKKRAVREEKIGSLMNLGLSRQHAMILGDSEYPQKKLLASVIADIFKNEDCWKVVQCWKTDYDKNYFAWRQAGYNTVLQPYKLGPFGEQVLFKTFCLLGLL